MLFSVLTCDQVSVLTCAPPYISSLRSAACRPPKAGHADAARGIGCLLFLPVRSATAASSRSALTKMAGSGVARRSVRGLPADRASARTTLSINQSERPSKKMAAELVLLGPRGDHLGGEATPFPWSSRARARGVVG